MSRHRVSERHPPQCNIQPQRLREKKGGAGMRIQGARGDRLPPFLLFTSLCFWVSVGNPLRADTFYPMIMAVRPVAVQAGKTCACEFESRYNLHGAYRVFVSGTGVVREGDPPPAPKPGVARPQVSRLKVRFKTAADALPGM